MPDTPTRPTLLQRVVMWILHALMFYVVALYPVLLMAQFQPDDVVHYGFLRWIAVVLVLYWAASQLFFTQRPVDTRPGRQTLAVIAAFLLLIGAFSPIVSFSFVGDVDFFRDGYGDGYILLIMAATSLALAVTGRWKQVLVPALAGTAVVLWTFLSVQDTISAVRAGGAAALAGNPHDGLAPATMASIQWEWGWILLFAGSGLLVYSAARRDPPEPEYPPLVSVAGGDEPADAAAAEPRGESGAATAPVGQRQAAEGSADTATGDSAAAPAEGPAAAPESAGTASEASGAATTTPADAAAADDQAPAPPTVEVEDAFEVALPAPGDASEATTTTPAGTDAPAAATAAPAGNDASVAAPETPSESDAPAAAPETPAAAGEPATSPPDAPAKTGSASGGETDTPRADAAAKPAQE